MALISPSFALLFPITFPTRFPTSFLNRFRTPNRFQNQSKNNQKFLPNSDYKQVLFQLHLRSNFEDNLMFKQNGRFSKIVPKPTVFVCFLDIRSCQPKQTRDMQRIDKSSNAISKIHDFCIEGKFFRSFLASISKAEIWTSWGRSWARFWLRFPTMLGSKTTSERHQKIITKKSANISPT